MRGLPALFLGLLISACGTEAKQAGDSAAQNNATKNPDATSTNHPMMVTTEAALQPCTEATEGWIAYVAADKLLKGCTAGSWATLDLQKGEAGAAGAAGKDGANGKDGAAGKDGASDKIVATYLCYDQIVTGLHVNYHASIMANGDVFASGSTRNSRDETGASNFWAAEQTGAATGYLSWVDDGFGAASDGYFTVELNRDTLVLTTTFHDAADTVYTSTPDKCTKHTGS